MTTSGAQVVKTRATWSGSVMSILGTSQQESWWRADRISVQSLPSWPLAPVMRIFMVRVWSAGYWFR